MVGCQAVADTAVDCGNQPAGTTIVVEAGYVRVDAQTVYLVPDPQVAARLQGCLLPVSTAVYHCQYWPANSLDWSLDGSTLTFTNRGGMPRGTDNASIKPWTKIG